MRNLILRNKMTCPWSGWWCWLAFAPIFHLATKTMHDCLTWFPSHSDQPPLPGISLARPQEEGSSAHSPVAQSSQPLFLCATASCLSLLATHHHLSHRRPGILVLINDADWELLVSTLGDIPPPAPALAASVGKHWASPQAHIEWLGNPPPHSSPTLRLLESPTPGEEGMGSWGHGSTPPS